MITARDFYRRLTELAGQPPRQRQAALAELHAALLPDYLRAVERLSAAEAAQASSDGRTRAQVVGHIAEWDRYAILAVGEMMAGVTWPQYMSLAGYQEPDGRPQRFSNVADFNAHVAAKHAGQAWALIQTVAQRAARTLFHLLTAEDLLPPDLLEQTGRHRWRRPDAVSLELPAGWYIWMVHLKHELYSHADLGLPVG